MASSALTKYSVTHYKNNAARAKRILEKGKKDYAEIHNRDDALAAFEKSVDDAIKALT